MKRYRLTIAYDGSGYAGWQVQRANPTVQAKVQAAIMQITGQKVIVHGSGRTDQGVHARRQMAHCDLDGNIRSVGLADALNGVLPLDIRILGVRQTTKSFHARRSAVTKEYRYFIWNGQVLPPFLRLYRTHIRNELNIADMIRASHYLVGRHDFAAFAANPGRTIESSVRNLSCLNVKRRGKEVVIIAKCDGFLYKMVRSLAGFLIRVGQAALPADEAKRVLASRVRTARVPTAPPQGLFLWNVLY